MPQLLIVVRDIDPIAAEDSSKSQLIDQSTLLNICEMKGLVAISKYLQLR